MCARAASIAWEPNQQKKQIFYFLFSFLFDFQVRALAKWNRENVNKKKSHNCENSIECVESCGNVYDYDVVVYVGVSVLCTLTT